MFRLRKLGCWQPNVTVRSTFRLRDSVFDSTGRGSVPVGRLPRLCFWLLSASSNREVTYCGIEVLIRPGSSMNCVLMSYRRAFQLR